MRRPLYSWPGWLLRAVLRLPMRRALWSDAWLELHTRATVDVVDTEADAQRGPWRVSPPKGFN